VQPRDFSGVPSGYARCWNGAATSWPTPCAWTAGDPTDGPLRAASAQQANFPVSLATARIAAVAATEGAHLAHNDPEYLDVAR